MARVKQFKGYQNLTIYAELKEYSDDYILSENDSENIAEEIETVLEKKYSLEREELELDDDVTICLELQLEVTGTSVYYAGTWLEPPDCDIEYNQEYSEKEFKSLLEKELPKYQFRVYLNDDVEISEEW